MTCGCYSNSNNGLLVGDCPCICDAARPCFTATTPIQYDAGTGNFQLAPGTVANQHYVWNGSSWVLTIVEDSFTIEDSDSNQEIINLGGTIRFTGANGIDVDVISSDTVRVGLPTGNDVGDILVWDGNDYVAQAPVDNDSQTLSVDNTAGTISISGGNTVSLVDLIDDQETLTSISYSATTNIITYLDEEGDPTNLDLGDLQQDISVDPINGTITIDGGSTIDLGPLISNAETVTTLTIVGNTLRYEDEDGVITTLDLCPIVEDCQNISIITDNGDGTYTHDDGEGLEVTIDTNANSNPFDPSTTALTATNVQGAIEELANGSFDITDGVTTETVNIGDTITFVGIGVTVEVSATDTVTITSTENKEEFTNLTTGNQVILTGIPNTALPVSVIRNGSELASTDYSLVGTTVTFTDNFGISVGGFGGEYVIVRYYE